MPVTQDYKTFTFTKSEYNEVYHAISERVRELNMRVARFEDLGDESYTVAAKGRLVAAQSAFEKVQA